MTRDKIEVGVPSVSTRRNSLQRWCFKTAAERHGTMSENLPWSLLIAYGCMSEGIFAAQWNVRRFDATGRGLGPPSIQISAALGTVASIGTLIHYFVMTPWYWVLVLFTLGIIVSVFISLLIAALLGRGLRELLLTYGWIAFAVWANILISNL